MTCVLQSVDCLTFARKLVGKLKQYIILALVQFGTKTKKSVAHKR